METVVKKGKKKAKQVKSAVLNKVDELKEKTTEDCNQFILDA